MIHTSKTPKLSTLNCDFTHLDFSTSIDWAQTEEWNGSEFSTQKLLFLKISKSPAKIVEFECQGLSTLNVEGSYLNFLNFKEWIVPQNKDKCKNHENMSSIRFKRSEILFLLKFQRRQNCRLWIFLSECFLSKMEDR